jgi:hypothetical protein
VIEFANLVTPVGREKTIGLQSSGTGAESPGLTLSELKHGYLKNRYLKALANRKFVADAASMAIFLDDCLHALISVYFEVD